MTHPNEQWPLKMLRQMLKEEEDSGVRQTILQTIGRMEQAGGEDVIVVETAKHLESTGVHRDRARRIALNSTIF